MCHLIIQKREAGYKTTRNSPKRKKSKHTFRLFLRAKDEARTRDNQLGRLELYQLSYFRITTVQI